MTFPDRQTAGQQLAEKLQGYAGQPVVVYALPRGGVVPGAEVAKTLQAPLDLIITRKIGHPLSPEYAIAAVTEDGELVRNEQEVARVDQAWFRDEVARQQAEAQRRRQRYLGQRTPVPVRGQTAILVDDGVATGLTVRAAIAELRQRQPKKIVVAVPVLPPEIAEMLKRDVDDLVYLDDPARYRGAVGAHYESFPQVADQEVEQLLAGSH